MELHAIFLLVQKQVDSLNSEYKYLEKQLDSLEAASRPKKDEIDRLEELKKIISTEEKEIDRLIQGSKKLKEKVGERWLIYLKLETLRSIGMPKCKHPSVSFVVLF